MWQISIASNAGGTWQSFASLNCSALRRNLRSQAAGEFTFTETCQAMDAAPLGSIMDVCAVRWVPELPGDPEEAVIFTGRLTKIPRLGAPAMEARRYVISDAWNDLERLTYQQQWNSWTGEDQGGSPTFAYRYRSEFIMGIDPVSGGAQTSDETIIAVLNWAISCGAELQVGTILQGGGPPVPWKPGKDMPCSRVIQELLRLTPDAVTSMDYTVFPPRLNITRRQNCTAVGIAMNGNIEKIDLTPRNDLVRSAVVIHYLSVGQSDGKPVVQEIIDAAPEGADGTAFDSIVATVRLNGGDSTYQKQKVTAEAMPTAKSADGEGGPSTDPTILWWQRKVGWLANLGAPGVYDASEIGDQLVITNVYGTYLVGQGNDDGTGDIAVSPAEDGYPNELIAGTLADWMGVQWAGTSWTALCKYSYPSSTADYSSQDWQATKTFGPDDGSGFSPALPVAGNAMLTNAVTQTYMGLTSYTNAEAAPEGFAAILYSALNPLHYEGEVSTVSGEVTGNSLGTVLNVTGSQQPWAAMNALVQEISDELETGRTTWKVGPPAHLNVQDLMSMLNYTRSRVPSSRVKEQQTGSPGDSAAAVEGGIAGPLSGGTSAPQYIEPVETPFQVLDASGQSNLAVAFNSYSYLFNSPDITDTNTIDGLDTSGLSVSVGDWIYLEIDFNDDLTLNGNPSIGNDSGWPGDSSELQYNVDSSGDNPYISSWYVPIAQIVDQSDATPGTNFQSTDGTVTGKIVQLLSTHLILTAWAVQGMVVNVPSAWTGTAS
jgi:hypothetical protein